MMDVMFNLVIRLLFFLNESLYTYTLQCISSCMFWLCVCLLLLLLFVRRVHVSQSTFEQLGDTFDVEPGNGGLRDAYLEERNMKTYFIAEKVH